MINTPSFLQDVLIIIARASLSNAKGLIRFKVAPVLSLSLQRMLIFNKYRDFFRVIQFIVLLLFIFYCQRINSICFNQ